jgi:hypothetical protein
MKTQLSAILLILVISSCTKGIAPVAPSPAPVGFTATVNQTLGTFDDTGRPTNLETPDVISSSLLTFLHTTLPEGVDLNTTHPELLSSTAIPDISLTQKTELHMTFVSSGSGNSNTIGFYTYPTNNPPTKASDVKNITVVFPNAGSNTPLKPGDKMNMGTFDAGTSVGFVLMSFAWNATSKTLNYNVVHYCSNDILNTETNPAIRKHAVLLNYAPESKILIGFEDMDRSLPYCDNDFNDVVFYISMVAK